MKRGRTPSASISDNNKSLMCSKGFFSLPLPNGEIIIVVSFPMPGGLKRQKVQTLITELGKSKYFNNTNFIILYGACLIPWEFTRLLRATARNI